MIPEWPKRGQKREPLITFDELYMKLGVGKYELMELLRHNPGLRPELVSRRTMNCGERSHYRWSEAKRWYAGVLAAQQSTPKEPTCE